jgi:SAM-dependent methyltransferase
VSGVAPSCPLCGAGGAPAFVVSGYAHHGCLACGSLFVSPVPATETLRAVYDTAPRDLGSATCWEGSARHSHPSWERVLADVRRLSGVGPLLDVGCGAGQFLAFARSRGFDALDGLELAADVARVARERTGARVQELDLDAAALEPGTFAAVTMWDVFEHLGDPRAALRRARALLRPGGVVAIGTPSREGITLRLRGRRAHVISPPEHLFLATRRGLRAACEAARLEIVRLEAEQIRIAEWLPSQASPAAGRPSGGCAYARAYALLTGPAALAIQRIANGVLRATRLGDHLVVVARRPEGARTCPCASPS